MNTRKEITKKYALKYRRASKKDKGQMLDHLVATIGWSRANTRRALVTALAPKVASRKRAFRKPTYGYESLKALIHIWNLAGRPSGKYIAVVMELWLLKLDQHGELDQERITCQVRGQGPT